MFDRTSQGLGSRWWFSVDRGIFLCALILLIVGSFLVASASPPVAERIGLSGDYFWKRHIVLAVVSFGVLCVMSLLPVSLVRTICVYGFGIGLMLMVLVIFTGEEVKGARQWIRVLGFSLQPSELVKPMFIVLTGLILSRHAVENKWRGFALATAAYVPVIGLLLAQPDVGMAMVVTAVWGTQLFIAGLPMFIVVVLGILGVLGIVGAYFTMDHVRHRIQGFFDPSTVDNYQNSKALQAFQNGGLTGTGPGDGVIKKVLPDSHTDFIFAVAGEEYGLLSWALVALFAIIVIRGFLRIFRETDLFTVYSASGLLILFGLQAMINMGVTLNLIPNTGMTLPFISYGGSSMLSVALTLGIFLCLTRQRFGRPDNRTSSTVRARA